MKANRILFIIFIALTSCAYKPIKTEEVAFYEPKSFSEKVIYHATKATTLTWIHPATSPTLLSLTGFNRLKDMGRDFLKDLGGESVQITTFEGATVDGMYFNPEIFRKNETAVFKKWKVLLAQPKNCKLSQIFEVNFQSNSLPSFFSFPRDMKSLPGTKKRPIGVLCLPASGLVYELDPKFILTFLLRGIHVLAINYRGVIPGDGVPNWKGTSLDAKNATLWLQRHIRAPFEDLMICGKSLGTGPAVYAAVECPGTTLILDRGFSRMSSVCDYGLPWLVKYLFTPFAKTLIEKYYRYPNEDWIQKVTGKLLIIEAKEDKYMAGQAEKLFEAFCKNKSEEDKKSLKDSIWIQVAGGHYGQYWGDSIPSWYSDEKSQNKLNHFLQSCINPEERL